MGDKAITGFVAVIMAIIGVAIVAVLVSKNANTGNVLTAGGGAFSNILKTALAPVSTSGGPLSGGVSSANLSQGFTFLQ